jgi:hypothetical protein
LLGLLLLSLLLLLRLLLLRLLLLRLLLLALLTGQLADPLLDALAHALDPLGRALP